MIYAGELISWQQPKIPYKGRYITGTVRPFISVRPDFCSINYNVID